MVRKINISNFYISKNGKIKILNFSFSKNFTDSEEKSKMILKGSPIFLAPEIIKDNLYSQASDVWAIGILAIYLFWGESPYKQDSINMILKIVKQEPPIPKK